MGYDEVLAERLRDLLDGHPDVTEKKMFGGLAFLVAGNMAIAASGQGGILVRVDPARSDRLVDTTNAETAVMRNRPMQGWLRVAPEHLRTKRQLVKWADLGRTYASSLPAKPKMYRTRDAIESDVPAITNIFNALITTTTYEWTETPHTSEERRRWLLGKQTAGEPVLVTSDDGAVVGVATYADFRDSRRWPGYRFTVEHTVHVAESHWGRGVGRSLISALAARARRERKCVMVAAIDSSNIRSVEFHARLGFDEVARMPGIGEKWGRSLDLVLMQCDLAQVEW